MADKELNPSPKFPQGTYPQLSPNPKFENGLVDKTGEQPNGSEQTNPQEKPTILNGEVYVNGKLVVNGKEVVTEEGELPPTDTAQQGDVLQLNNQKKPIWGAVKLENIVDKDGHKRFVQNIINIETITGVVKTYGRWALSGTHLLIVLALDLADTTALDNGVVIAKLNLPDWIKGKIVSLWGSYYIASRSFGAYADNWTTQQLGINLVKVNNEIRLSTAATLTLTANRHCRIEFDLLIDND